MSFTSEIKKEAYSNEHTARHCMIAETAAIIICCGGRDNSGNFALFSDNKDQTMHIVNLLNKTYGAGTVDKISNSEPHYGKDTMKILISGDKLPVIFSSVKFPDRNNFTVPAEIPGILLKNSCCKRAALTAWFLCLGSVSDPEKNYHCEYVCVSEEQAEQIIELLTVFDITAHKMIRKNRVVVYIKESESIAELLNVIGAHRALMKLENLRIEKGLRNDVNRAVNCDTANAKKLAAASGRQIEDIIYLRDNVGMSNLPDNLRDMAAVRIENPDLPLKDLGGLLDPPIGKSGVNHRLRKLSELADEYRNKESHK